MNNSSIEATVIDRISVDEMDSNIINFYQDDDNNDDPIFRLDRRDCKCAQEHLRTKRFSNGSYERTISFVDYNLSELFKENYDGYSATLWFEHIGSSVMISHDATLYCTDEHPETECIIHFERYDEIAIAVPYEDFMNFVF